MTKSLHSEPLGDMQMTDTQIMKTIDEIAMELINRGLDHEQIYEFIEGEARRVSEEIRDYGSVT